MADFETMRDKIYDLVYAGSSVACIWGFQNAAPPNKPFFSLVMTSFRKIGRDDLVGPDNNGKFTLKGNRDFTLLVRGFGFGIVEKTHTLQQYLERPDIHESFKVAGCFPFDLDQPINDISGLDESENEERSAWDVFMRSAQTLSNVPAGLIEHVNAEGTYKNPGSSDIISILKINELITP
jgi:hypothetical protein